MKTTQTQLDEAIALHGKWLRNEPDVVRADLYGANLTEAKLRGADLRGANLIGANLCEANLCEANLTGADLRWAKLYGANLSGAILGGANLNGADLRYCIGNAQEVKLVQTSRWTVTYTAEVMAIGCQQHGIAEWWAFTDSEIARMDREALDWWRVWKPILQQIITASPAVHTGHEGC